MGNITGTTEPPRRNFLTIIDIFEENIIINCEKAVTTTLVGPKESQ